MKISEKKEKRKIKNSNEFQNNQNQDFSKILKKANDVQEKQIFWKMTRKIQKLMQFYKKVEF